jgi:hypothetical protein
VEDYSRPGQATHDNIIWRIRYACCVTEATDTHSEYAIFIAFPGQQFLRERASMLTFICTLPLLQIILTIMQTTIGSVK